MVTVIQENMPVVSAWAHKLDAREPMSRSAADSVRNTTSADLMRLATEAEACVASRSTCCCCSSLDWRCACLASSQINVMSSTAPQIAADSATRRPSPLKIAARGLCIALFGFLPGEYQAAI
jgi:hypothetical protein